MRPANRQPHRSQFVRWNHKTMKLTPLFSDPIGWSEQVAKSRNRVKVLTVLHVSFISIGLLLVYWRICALGLSPVVSLATVLVGMVPIVFMGIILPAFYLNALHQLLKLVGDRKEDVNAVDELSQLHGIGSNGRPTDGT